MKSIVVIVVVTILFLIALSVQADNQADSKPEYGPDTGALEVGSSPTGASIYLYYDLVGTTPSSGYFIKSNLNPGVYPLRLTLPGYYDYVTDVKIPRNKLVTVDAVLWPLSGDQVKVNTGNLTIKSNPSKADVILDDNYKGLTPQNLKNVNVGSHIVVIKKDGYSDYLENVTVSSDQTALISVNLTLG